MARLHYHLIPLTILLGFIFNSYAAEVLLPNSVLKNGTEIFDITCPGNPQQTTIDLNDCIGDKINAAKSVEMKYTNTARQRISADDDKETLDAFEAENKAWDALIDAASHATDVEWRGGTIRGVKAADRELYLIELRVHNQWQNWLRYEDSTPPVLPEPLFRNDE